MSKEIAETATADEAPTTGELIENMRAHVARSKETAGLLDNAGIVLLIENVSELVAELHEHMVSIAEIVEQIDATTKPAAA